jgi:DNA-binding CsgD family transcriptional regulator
MRSADHPAAEATSSGFATLNVEAMQIVGRDRELSALLTAVARVQAAGLVAVAVSGEAGIGKSRLINAAADHLGGQSWRVLPVRADRLERQVPYAAVAAALRSFSGDNSFTEGVRRGALAALELPLETSHPAGTAFGWACASTARLLTALTAAGPLAVLVDDLHELDDDSLSLLAVVLSRLSSAPIGFVAALRSHIAEPNPAAQELLDRLSDTVDLVRLELGTLPAGDIGEMIAPLLGAAADEDLVAEVHRRCDGNPFFAVQIAHSLVDTGAVVVDGSRARLAVDSGVIRLTRRAAVLRRVLPLSPDAGAVARVLAVFRKVSLERIALLAQVAGLSEAAVATAFDDLVRAHVVVHDAGQGYRFSHDIVAEALYDEIGPAQCRRIHGLVAQRLHAQRRQGETVDLLELAWHVSESAAPGDPQAVEILAEAAQRALTAAPEAAAGFCARALGLLGQRAPQRPGLLALQCRALARASRPAAALAPGREALALLPAGEERLRTATAVLGSLFALDRIDEAIEVADEQVRDGSAPAALRAQRAVLLVFAGRTVEAQEEAAAALSTPVSSPAEEVMVYGQLAILTSMLFRHNETVDHADRALAAAGGSTTLQLQALAVGALTEALAGLVPQATRRLRLADELTADGVQLFHGEFGVARVVLDWLGGRWDTALERMRTVAAELEVQQVSQASALTAVELEIRTWRGELVPAKPLAERAAPAARNMASLHAWALAGYLAARGDSGAARRTLMTAADDPAVATYVGLLLSRLAELQVEQGLPDEAAKTLVRLSDLGQANATPWGRTTLHRTAGLVNGDTGEMMRAVREAELGGLVFERARALLFLGELDPGGGEGLVEAYRLFARLGADGLRRRAGRRLHELGAKVPRTRSRAAGLLTESEEKVARLVQQGMRNREIASTLHYSPRSIEVYLSRIYAKLRVSSRLELARALDAMDAQGEAHP